MKACCAATNVPLFYIMKKTFLLFASLLPFMLYAGACQDTTQPSSYFFEHFAEGQVLMKTGVVEHALLNYDADHQHVIFKKDGQQMVLTGLDQVDTVYILDKKFVAIEDAFYEVGTTTPIALFIMYTTKMQPLVASTGHAGTSRQSGSQVNNTVSEVYLNRRFQGQYEIQFIRHYWLRKGHSMYKANNEKQVVKVFPRKEADIREFVEKNGTSFSNPGDVARLVRFCNEGQ